MNEVAQESKEKRNLKILFIIDSIKIGGIERLCFDESYELISRNVNHEIICLTDEKFPSGSILEIDANYPKIKEINLTFLGNTRIKQILNLKKIIRRDKNQILRIISHSTRGAVIARISSVISFKKINITLFIHQLISMSDLRQKLKRIIHSLFADAVTTSSLQFKLEWENYIKSNALIRMFYRKKIDFNRMGVYLPRLRNSEKIELSSCTSSSLHLLFMSRITTWKGYPIFADICNKMASEGIHSVVISNENSRKEIFRREDYDNDKNHYVPNNGIANLKFSSEVVHLYPTNYGSHIMHPQSIGMNVLECVAIGIPSLISHDNYETWPEFRNNPMVRIVDWENIDEIVKVIYELTNSNQLEKFSHYSILEDAIDVKNHVNRILKLI